MEEKVIRPIAAFDVEQGTARALTDPWPSNEPVEGYRWLHLDLNDQSTETWAKEHLNEIAAMALLQPETRPRCERHEGGLILNLRGVNLNPESDPEDMVSLRMWVAENCIVSARVRKVWAVDTIRAAAEGGRAPATVGKFIAELAHALTKRIEEVSLTLEDSIDQFEEELSDGTPISTEKIASVRRATIKMRRFLNPQREAISALAAVNDWFLSAADTDLLRETSNRAKRTIEELDAIKDRLAALQDHIDSERSHALGRNSYVLSVVAAIFLPLGFLTGLFGVNVGGMPGTESDYAFWILIGISALSGIFLYLVFKFSKWL